MIRYLKYYPRWTQKWIWIAENFVHLNKKSSALLHSISDYGFVICRWYKYCNQSHSIICCMISIEDLHKESKYGVSCFQYLQTFFSSLKISCYVLHCGIANNNIPHWHNIMYKKLSLGATKHMCTVMVSRLRIYDLLLTNTILLNDSIHSKYISTQFLNNIKQTY